MHTVEIIGLAASVMTSVSMLPQLITLLREKDAGSVSYFMLAILIAGLAVWVGYGFMREDYIIVGANSFACLLNATVLVFALKYGRKKAG
jgi:MtN3 and saliva related transmembrane protein